MNTFVRQWYDLILNCSFDNTYKMVWSKALIELSLDVSNENKEETTIFGFYDIAKLCLKYYWNQTIYFDLIQSPNLKKTPAMITFTKDLIEAYFKKKHSVQPIRFEKIDFTSLQLLERYEGTIKNIAKTLKQDVCWRFKNLNRKIYEIYDLDPKVRYILIKRTY